MPQPHRNHHRRPRREQPGRGQPDHGVRADHGGRRDGEQRDALTVEGAGQRVKLTPSLALAWTLLATTTTFSKVENLFVHRERPPCPAGGHRLGGADGAGDGHHQHLALVLVEPHQGGTPWLTRNSFRFVKGLVTAADAALSSLASTPQWRPLGMALHRPAKRGFMRVPPFLGRRHPVGDGSPWYPPRTRARGSRRRPPIAGVD